MTKAASRRVAPPLSISRIGQVSIAVEDLPRAEAFYRDVLGLKHLFTVAERMAFFDCDGLRLVLDLMPPGEDDPGTSIVYFKVDDIAASFALVETHGATTLQVPEKVAAMGDHDLWMAFFEDSEGNPMALMEERRPPSGTH